MSLSAPRAGEGQSDRRLGPGRERGKEAIVLVGVLATVLGCLLHTWAAVAAARLNFGSRFPYLWGMYPVRPTRRVKRAQTAGWLLSIVGAFGVARRCGIRPLDGVSTPSSPYSSWSTQVRISSRQSFITALFPNLEQWRYRLSGTFAHEYSTFPQRSGWSCKVVDAIERSETGWTRTNVYLGVHERR